MMVSTGRDRTGQGRQIIGQNVRREANGKNGEMGEKNIEHELIIRRKSSMMAAEYFDIELCDFDWQIFSGFVGLFFIELTSDQLPV